MKKSLTILLTLGLVLFAFFGCGTDSQTKEVIAFIDAIGGVTLDSKDAIANAETAYAALGDSQRERVHNAETLTVARDIFDELMYRRNMVYVAASIRLNQLSARAITEGVSSEWRRAIDRRGDFNTAIRNYLNSSAVSNLQESMDERHDEIQSLMIGLQNPPSTFALAYSELVTLYGVYVEHLQQARSPSGSLQTFNSRVNDLTSQFSSISARLDIMLPELPDFDIDETDND
jgi:hypothetical protein